MKQTIAHDLPTELARTAAKAALAYYQQRHPNAHITPQWHGLDEAVVTFSLRGFHLKPRIRLRPGAIDVELEIPFLARPFEARARARIESELALWLDRARRGELSEKTTV